MKIEKGKVIIQFLKKYWAHIVACFLVIGIGSTIGVVAAINNNQSVIDVAKKEDEKNNSENEKNKPIDKKDNQEDSKKEGGNDHIDVDPVNTDPVTFSLPMSNAIVIKDYSDTKLMYNETLDRWESHLCIDMTADDLSVCSVLDGVVESVSYDYLTGNVITIKHDDGFVSKYASLNDDVLVKKGDSVLKGQIIGEASNLAASSSMQGNHLEFSLLKEGKKVDPNNYLDLQNK